MSASTLGFPAQSAENTAAPTFFPWPVLAALYLAFGVALAGLGLPWWSSLIFLLGVSASLLGWRSADTLPLLLLLTLLIPLGFWRYSLWQAQPHLLEPLMAQRLSFSGYSDGRYLTLSAVGGDRSYAGARVVLSPSGVVQPGRVTLEGNLAEAQGKRNPGGFDYRGYLERRGIRGQVYVREVHDFEPASITLREHLRQGVVANLDERAAGLMQAMTLGVRDNLGDLRGIFAASGLAHILALSGLHVGVLMAAVGLVLRPLGRGRYPVMILFVLGFVFLVGATPSVVRAGAMVTAVLVTLWLGSGRIEPWPALGLAALLTLAWNPSWLFDLSFQLSYLAVMGILIFAEPVMKLIFGRDFSADWWDPRVLVVGSAVVSASAQVLTLPLIAHAFGSVPLFSPLVNIVAIPLATVLVPLGFLAGVLGLVSAGLAHVLNVATGFFAGLLIRLADLASALPALPWGEIAPSGYLLYGVGCLALALTLQRRLKPWRGFLIVGVALGASTLLAGGSNPEIIFLDVGQGDGVVIRLEHDIDILVDGGGSVFSDFDVGARTVVPALRALGVRRLELVIASHAHVDHMEGLISVLDLMPVGLLIVGAESTGESMDREVFAELMASAERNGVPVMPVTRGESLSLGNARLDFLNPPQRRYGDVDADSVAFVLNIDDTAKALFLGDIPTAVEADLAFPAVDILMVPHHGSKHSSSDGLIAAAQPKRAVVSYGRNNYGHPSPEVLERLLASGAEVSETFLEGAVRVPLSP
ncbi:MAG: DNA internalization-related competence protein ComEC/Rec2 [Deinococcota bacterium]|nr:DNA internalization-related competence protein ComEC/Rec2 [Deinococcota bacterium]